MALAIVSSLRDIPVDATAVAIGEIGLGGEIRSVSQVEKRISEAGKLGFTRCLLPQGNARNIAPRNGVGVIEIETVDQAITALVGS